MTLYTNESMHAFIHTYMHACIHLCAFVSIQVNTCICVLVVGWVGECVRALWKPLPVMGLAMGTLLRGKTDQILQMSIVQIGARFRKQTD